LVLNLFSIWNPRNRPHPAALPILGAHDLITTPEHITGLLQQIKDNHVILTVTIKGSDQVYNSALFRIDPKNGYLYLDELVPREGHIRLSHEMSLRVKTRLNGAMISFPATVEKIDIEDGIPYYKIPFPEAIDYRQRRQHHRVYVPGDHNIPVHLHTDELRLLTGDLRNISLGGICFSLNKIASRRIQVGDIISKCVIDLPDARKVTIPIEIRSLNEQYPPSLRRIGGRFLELDKKDLQELQQLVLTLDRMAIKKQNA
jgi:c-di-GMP-binding flagellar brake protein YcgR